MSHVINNKSFGGGSKRPMNCGHPSFETLCRVQVFPGEGLGRHYIQIQARCIDCHEEMVFDSLPELPEGKREPAHSFANGTVAWLPCVMVSDIPLKKVN